MVAYWLLVVTLPDKYLNLPLQDSEQNLWWVSPRNSFSQELQICLYRLGIFLPFLPSIISLFYILRRRAFRFKRLSCRRWCCLFAGNSVQCISFRCVHIACSLCRHRHWHQSSMKSNWCLRNVGRVLFRFVSRLCGDGTLFLSFKCRCIRSSFRGSRPSGISKRVEKVWSCSFTSLQSQHQ